MVLLCDLIIISGKQNYFPFLGLSVVKVVGFKIFMAIILIM